MSIIDTLKSIAAANKKINEFTDEELHYKTFSAVQSAGLTTPKVSLSETGVSVCIRSTVHKKTVIVSMKNLKSNWAKAYREYDLDELEETNDRNMRNIFLVLIAMFADGKLKYPESNPVCDAWYNALRDAEFSLGDPKDNNKDPELKARYQMRQSWFIYAFILCANRMYGEIFNIAMSEEDEKQTAEGLILLLAERSKLYYYYSQGFLLKFRKIFDENTVEIKTVILDM